jgi:AraC-like DNA-binding protein
MSAARVSTTARFPDLGSLLLPALRHPDQANRLFVDHVLLAVGVHVAQTYGGMRPGSRPARGGLAPWQERRAREILRANLKGSVPLKEVARECGLSGDHFSHAFRRTLGVAPHKWLIEQRVALSKEKLRDDGLSQPVRDTDTQARRKRSCRAARRLSTRDTALTGKL